MTTLNGRHHAPLHRRSAPHKAPKPWGQKVFLAALGIVSSTLVALLVTSLYGWATRAADARPPLAAVLKPLIDPGCEGLVMSDPTPDKLPARDQFGPAWAYAHGGATYDHVKWELTLQGRSDESVVLHGIDVVDVDRQDLPAAPAIVSKCDASGGGFDARLFDLDFKGDQVKLTARPGVDDGGNTVEPAVSFPYIVSKSDAEVFYILAGGTECICSYRFSIRWSSGDRSGSLLVDRGFDKMRTAVVDDETPLPFDVWGADGSWETY